MLKDLFKDKALIESKYHNPNLPFDPFTRMAYHGCQGDISTGLDDLQMDAVLKELSESIAHLPHCLQKARMFECVLDNARIDVLEYDYFFCLYNWNRPLNKFTVNVWNNRAINELISEESKDFILKGTASGDIACWLDYDHSVPDWQALYTLGFAGILKRAQDYKAKKAAAGALSPKRQDFFSSIEIEYSAILRFIKRVYNLASTKKFAKAKLIAESMDNLYNGAPKTTFDVLQLIYLYFMLSESVDSYQVRSLGSGLDYGLYPYFIKDTQDGGFTKEQIAEFIGYFFMQFSAIGNYWGQPFYLSGTNLDGTTKVNEMSYLILDVYEKLGIYCPKIQIKYNAFSTPKKFIYRVLDLIRKGQSSFALICERNVYKGMEKRGIKKEKYFDFDVKGCYEFAVKANEVSTAPIYINLLSGVNGVIDEGLRHESYEQFEQRYYDKLNVLFKGAVKAVNEMEEYLEFVNPSPMFSATIKSSLEKGQDAYFKGSVYNSTAFIINGFASAVDALMGVKYLVYQTQQLTLPGLKDVLASDWKGFERLQTLVRNCAPKYGNGDEPADLCSQRLANYLAAWQQTPNARGGTYKTHIHSARTFITLGKATKASADGRTGGGETSKNGSPSAGMDTNGVTALILSVLKTQPWQFTEGHCLDIMLHPSALEGGEGLKVFKGLLDVYEQGGGLALNVNVFSADTLLQAQLEPEKYRNLQVRVCGWNVLFNNLPKEEQDEYIKRAARLV